MDEEEKKQDEDGFTKPLAPSSLCAPGGAGGGVMGANATMVIPDPGEFEKMAAKLCSTPFSGDFIRSFDFFIFIYSLSIQR